MSSSPHQMEEHVSTATFTSPQHKWLVILAAVFGVFMGVLDSTVVNMAAPRIQHDFAISLNNIQWIVTAYLLSLALSIPLAGYLAGRFGLKRVYLTALVIFTLSSALCGLAWDTNSLILFRIIQGLGGGALAPLATAMIYSAFSLEQRGIATGVLGVPLLIAPALGPALGGYIVQHADWRLIFYINVPIGILGVLIGLKVLKEHIESQTAKFDWLGFVLSTIGFACLLYGISSASTYGWESPSILLALIIGVISIVTFFIVELRVSSPLLDVRLYLDWRFAGSSVADWILHITFFGPLLLVSLYLQEIHHLPPADAGLWFVPSALVTAAILPATGMLVDRFGAKWIIFIGMIILAASTYGLSFFHPSTTFWGVQLVLVTRGIALAFTLQPLLVFILYYVKPPAVARASSLVNVMQQVAASFGTAILITYAQYREKVDAAHLLPAQAIDVSFHDAFLLAAIIASAGIIIALLLPRQRKQPAD
jgi:EmrB/QacA subfamily drug resistance transporter